MDNELSNISDKWQHSHDISFLPINLLSGKKNKSVIRYKLILLDFLSNKDKNVYRSTRGKERENQNKESITSR